MGKTNTNYTEMPDGAIVAYIDVDD
jgi:hypothetical protein